MIAHYKNFIIINVYVPNSGSNYDSRIKFNQAFLEYFKTIESPIIFCGDMNMAIDTYFDKTKVEAMPGIYPHELKFYEDLKTNAFKDTIDLGSDLIIYTWWNQRTKKVLNEKTGIEIGIQRHINHGWRLDYIFTRDFTAGKSRVLKHIGEETNPLGSDHAPVFGELHMINKCRWCACPLIGDCKCTLSVEDGGKGWSAPCGRL